VVERQFQVVERQIQVAKRRSVTFRHYIVTELQPVPVRISPPPFHILDSILLSSDSGKSTIVISLDLSAAFDTIDHQILLSRLNTSFGISDTTLSWLQSYLTNRTFYVRIGRHCSSSVTCTTGVPQGPVLGPLLFTTYVSPIAGIAHVYSIDQQQYADDTQLLSPRKLSRGIMESPALVCLSGCLSVCYHDN